MAATRTGIALTVVALAAFVSVSPTAARPDAAGSPFAHHAKKKKRKAIRCRKSEVPIKVRRRTVGCRKRRAALPRPRAGDQRLLLAKAALDDDLRALRDRRHRRPPSLKKLFRKVEPARLPDGAARHPPGPRPSGRAGRDGPGRVERRPRRREAVPSCGRSGGPLPTRTDTFTSSSGGQKHDRDRLARTGGDLRPGRSRVAATASTWRITTDECSRFDAPSCPTAAGVVDADRQLVLQGLAEGRQGRHGPDVKELRVHRPDAHARRGGRGREA